MRYPAAASEYRICIQHATADANVMQFVFRVHRSSFSSGIGIIFSVYSVCSVVKIICMSLKQGKRIDRTIFCSMVDSCRECTNEHPCVAIASSTTKCPPCRHLNTRFTILAFNYSKHALRSSAIRGS